MSRRNIGLAFIGGTLVAVFVLLLLATTGSNQHFKHTYIAVRDIAAGSRVAESDVKQIQVAADDQINTLDNNPAGKRASHQIPSGSSLSAGDFIQRPQVEVPVTLKNGGDFHGGDQADIYAFAAGKVILIARGVILTSSSQALVNPADEPYWLSLQAGGSVLYAARSTGTDLGPLSGITTSDALNHLAQQAGSGAAPSSSPSP